MTGNELAVLVLETLDKYPQWWMPSEPERRVRAACVEYLRTHPPLGQGTDPAPPVSAKAPDTGKLAAHAARHQAAQQRRRIHVYLTKLGELGATADELMTALEMSGNSLHPRLWELEGKNRKHPLPAVIKMTERQRRTRTGRFARVYVALTPAWNDT